MSSVLDADPSELVERVSFFNCVPDIYNNFGCSVSRPPYKFSKPGGHESDDYKENILGFFRNEPCPYNHRIFEIAAAIFDVMKHKPEDLKQTKTNKAAPATKATTATSGTGTVGWGTAVSALKPLSKRKQELAAAAATVAAASAASKISAAMELPQIEFKSENEKRISFRLVFQTLKYQKFLQEMLDNSLFFESFPEYRDEYSAVMVMLCDYQMRKFQVRLPAPDEEQIPRFSNIEQAIYGFKTKLGASLARSRIRARVLSLDFLLPESIRKNEKIGSRMNICCWVNQLKTTMVYMEAELRRIGFKEVDNVDSLVEQTYMFDQHCEDLICFPFDQQNQLEQSSYCRDGYLVIQDKSSCIPCTSMFRLFSDGDDILHVNVGSGITSAHLASLTHHSKQSTIYCMGLQSEKHHKQILANITRLGARGRIKIIEGDFLTMNVNDEKLRDIKLVLVTAVCTKSGVANPVNFLISEGENLTMLRDLSLGYTDRSKVDDFVLQHIAALKQALLLPRAQGVVYYTRSAVEAENENVVNVSVEGVNTQRQTRTPFRVAPPVLMFDETEIESDIPVYGKFLKFPTSIMMSGCFIVAATREADNPTEAAKDILARAAARGIIRGVAGDPTAAAHATAATAGGASETVVKKSKNATEKNKTSSKKKSKGDKKTKGEKKRKKVKKGNDSSSSDDEENEEDEVRSQHSESLNDDGNNL